MKDSKILLIGGNGLLGQSLQKELNKNEFTAVFTCSRVSSNSVNHIQGDLLDLDLVRILTAFNFDLIINLTGQITKPIADCLALNSVGIENLIQIIHNSPNCKLIQISTVGVYGSCDFADEFSELNPETPYSNAKCEAEKLLISKLNADRLVIFRVSNLYGEKQLKGVFAYLNKAAESDQILDFNNDGSLVRFFIHTNDCAAIIVEFIRNHIQHSTGIYNVIGTDHYSILQLIQLFEEIKQLKFKINLDIAKPYDNALAISDKKIRKLFDYLPKMNVRSYLQTI
ncbi:NAD-dependent epimerase/dehydratase family protein [Flavobacterium cellulosilyticum]|uniref:NAD(P)-dependent oxidoreductase n=1 Tax=Flavobacterium cellulosilyticum TaxID=2541731 RepID=A0A4R5CH71_9FLAO|nr:NAD(P)-dependent oxidoreductase [Flavobacterium cellulosilyticum]TDD98409.1 NAD(P)-dependent oxidoreductase [Flavobacterium cellulosilyticum]